MSKRNVLAIIFALAFSVLLSIALTQPTHADPTSTASSQKTNVASTSTALSQEANVASTSTVSSQEANAASSSETSSQEANADPTSTALSQETNVASTKTELPQETGVYPYNFGDFVIISVDKFYGTYSHTVIYTLYYPDTMVMYTFIVNHEGMTAIEMHNPDGSPMLYSPNTEVG